MRIHDITIAIIDCINPTEALRLLYDTKLKLRNTPYLKYAKYVLLCGDAMVAKGITIDKIPMLSSGEEVSKFMLLDYHKHIDTPYLLNMQLDGYVVKPEAWDPTFLDYDYIGAPWKLHPHHEWPPFPNVTEENRVGNGGFSLRTHKMMEIISILFERLRKDIPEKYVDEPKHYHPEDCFMCRSLRQSLKKRGIKFAPYNIAKKFSCENEIYDGQFGFHGKQTIVINNESK